VRALALAVLAACAPQASSLACPTDDAPPPSDAAPCTADPFPPASFPDVTGQGHLTVTLQAPSTYASAPCRPRSLLLYMNGYKADGGSVVGRFRHTGIEDEHDVLTIAPTGIAGSTGYRRWNATPACCEPVQPANDDVAYLAGLVERVIAAGWSVDRSRVYALGMSNGAVMALRLGCERPDLFVGVVAISGVGMSGGIGCTGAPVHMALQHSKADSFFLYSGGTANLPPLMPATYPAIEAAGGLVDQAREKNGCAGGLRLVQSYAYDFDYPGFTYPVGIKDTDELAVDGCPEDGSVTFWRAPYPAPVGGATYGHSLHPTDEFGDVVWNWIAAHPRSAPP
jgi:poly(3-hydroxybutyrate) depolymerase